MPPPYSLVRSLEAARLAENLGPAVREGGRERERREVQKEGGRDKERRIRGEKKEEGEAGRGSQP